jgi:hypothetical protein
VVLTKERGTVPIETCKVGEHLCCPSAAAGESWTRIIRLEVRDAETFIRLHFSNAESLDVTPHHIFTLADGSPMRAERLCLSDIFTGRFARLTLTRIESISANSPTARAAVPHASRSAGFQPANLPSPLIPSAVPQQGNPAAPRASRSAGFQPANLPSPLVLSAVPQQGNPAAPHASRSAGLQPANLPSPVDNSPCNPDCAVADDLWQKVTVSCEPSHQFFAGRHSASILTHNYTFSS